MAKTTKHEAEETATIRVSKEEWEHIYNASEKQLQIFTTCFIKDYMKN